MDKRVEVVKSDKSTETIFEVVSIWLGVNSLSIEKSDGTILLIPYRAIESISFDKSLIQREEDVKS